ncbi:hybrid sensor histidine kinase/response regulator transcription factor [Saccharicrinis aurantiacus]|uniref:hybrid sensor histidine kinase/response regulator transcription factor n=1 Tax=Saccharicrinis aurantiacus TaxID=1849719 RepID=UPI00094F8E4E|nr:hybrid sensor histidine kinase/response regulator transcription factor [Saccharicrinis aurantiacus]
MDILKTATNSYIKAFISTLLLSFSLCLGATSRPFEAIQHLSVDEGLTHHGVTCVLEDSKGYVWIGTYDGLHRYDGYGFEVTRNRLGDKIILSNRIRSLAEDKHGDIWIGTDEGLSIYDYSTGHIENVYSNSLFEQETTGPIIRKILITEESILCITELNGVLIFNHDYTLKNQYIPQIDISREIKLRDVIELDKNNYLISSTIGALLFDKKTGEFTHHLKELIYSSTSCIKINRNNMVISASRGLVFINYDLDNTDQPFGEMSSVLKDIEVSALGIDKFNNLWVGERNDGLCKITNVKGVIAGFKPEIVESDLGVESIRASTIHIGANDRCWFGSFNNGVYRFSINENPYYYHSSEEDDKYGITSNRILNVEPYDDNRVFVSAYFGGFGLFNTLTHLFEPLPFSLPEDQWVKESFVFVDSRGIVWISSSYPLHSLLRIKPGERKASLIKGNSFPKMKGIRSITEDHKGNLWIACINGLFRVVIGFNGEVEKVEDVNNNSLFIKDKLDLVRYVYADPLHDFVWVGTDTEGLLRIDKINSGLVEDLVITKYTKDQQNSNSISSNFVTSIVRIPNGELWIGTEQGGICKVINSEKHPSFISFSEKQGLSNEVVKSIVCDNDNNLWIATNRGLNLLNTKNMNIRRIRKRDGLPYDGFGYSTCMMDNGRIVTSSQNGFFYFNPKVVKESDDLPKFEFGNVQLFNSIVSPGDTIGDRVLLEKRIEEQRSIELEYDENIIGIELISLHLQNSENYFLQYRLPPFSDKWMKISSDERYLHFNGLPPGEYELEVMASNAKDEWTDIEKISILIHPPIWKTKWAIASYLIIVIIMIIGIIKTIISMQSLKHNLEIEQLEKTKTEEVSDVKFKFFSNISHEFKTPLTLISAPIDILLERFNKDTDVNNQLLLVKRQAGKMSQLVDQVHDFQKADKNLLKMNYSQFTFNGFISSVVNDFTYLASDNNKTLKLEKVTDIVFVLADRDKLEKIFNNLLNNAFKFTDSNDSININYHVKGNELEITVSDTGKGIDQVDLPFVFDRFYQSKKKHSAYTGGSGIGLAFSKRLVEMHYGSIKVSSELGIGTEFTIVLPIVVDGKNAQYDEKVQKIISEEENYRTGSAIKDVDELLNFKVDEDLNESIVFFVEDNDDMRNFVESVLSKYFKVKSFANGQACVNAMETEWPDLILSDVLMPQLNGFELCEKVKSDIKTSHIPVILLTACTTIEDQIEGLKMGADAYIKKPFNLLHLVTRAETLLLSRKKLRERYQVDYPLSNEKQNSEDDAFLNKLYELMEASIDDQDLVMDQFAKELFLNRTHFYQKVKALTNQTPYDLLKSYRLKKGARLLAQERLPVGEVCLLIGFKSRTHFSKLFKETYNVTPGKYAAEQAKKLS